MDRREIKFSRSFSTERKNAIELEEEVLARIEEVREGGCIVGEGKTAKVFICEKDPWACYKIVSKPYCPRLSVDQEMKFMDEVTQLEIRIPLPLFCINYEGMETLVMERINGHTIREIIKERLDLPKDFNLVSFFQELKGFMEKIHNNRIYHRDFHEGNIMIDENGRPWIIDFGDACYAFDEEEAYSSSFINPNTRRTETMKYTSDNNNLAAVQISLRKYIFSRQKNI